MPQSQTHKLPIVDNCQGCGVCCLHIGYPPYIRPTENREGEKWWYLLPAELKEELDHFIANYKARDYDGTVESLDPACCWYDQPTGRCIQHEFRPQVCRDFQPGSKGCQEWRSYYADRIQPISQAGQD